MDDLGKSIPAAEAMVDAEQEGKRKLVNENCLNCGEKLIDSYCHHCGQKDIPRRQTLGDMLINFISSFWSYEGKFFRTTRYLITSPGLLAVEYNAGRRESYYHPARMYVFMSFVFFLVYVSVPDEKDGVVQMNFDDIADFREEMKAEGVDTLAIFKELSDSALLALSPVIQDSIDKRDKRGGVRLSGADYKSIEAYDSVQMTKPLEERDGWVTRKMQIRSIELNERYKGTKGKFVEDFTQMFKDSFSKVLFWLLPFFALVLKFLYVRRDFYYSEHLVLTIYYYNFFYLAGSVIMLVGLIPGLDFVGTVLGFWIYFYLLFAMKRLYKQEWGVTIAKFVLFSFIFSLFVLAGFTVSILWIFALL